MSLSASRTSILLLPRADAHVQKSTHMWVLAWLRKFLVTESPPSGPLTEKDAFSAALMLITSIPALGNDAIAKRAGVQRLLEARAPAAAAAAASSDTPVLNPEVWLALVQLLFENKSGALRQVAEHTPSLQDAFPWTAPTPSSEDSPISYWRALLYTMYIENSERWPADDRDYLRGVAASLLKPFDSKKWYDGPSTSLGFKQSLQVAWGRTLFELLPMSPIGMVVGLLVQMSLNARPSRAEGVGERFHVLPERLVDFWFGVGDAHIRSVRLTKKQDQDFARAAQILGPVLTGGAWDKPPYAPKWREHLDVMRRQAKESITLWARRSGVSGVLATAFSEAWDKPDAGTPADTARSLGTSETLQQLAQSGVGSVLPYTAVQPEDQDMLRFESALATMRRSAEEVAEKADWIFQEPSARNMDRWATAMGKIAIFTNTQRGGDTSGKQILAPISHQDFDASKADRGAVHILRVQEGRARFWCVVTWESDTPWVACPGRLRADTEAFTAAVAPGGKTWQPDASFATLDPSEESRIQYSGLLTTWVAQMLGVGFSIYETRLLPPIFSLNTEDELMYTFLRGEYVQAHAEQFGIEG